MKFNNKGQVLVLFMILLPIIILLLLITIQLGNVYLEKIKTRNAIKEIITNNLKYYDEGANERINTLIDKNVSDLELKTIFTSEDEIRVHLIQVKKLFLRDIRIEYKFTGMKYDENVMISEG